VYFTESQAATCNHFQCQNRRFRIFEAGFWKEFQNYIYIFIYSQDGLGFFLHFFVTRKKTINISYNVGWPAAGVS
jgi:hypothetical protein